MSHCVPGQRSATPWNWIWSVGFAMTYPIVMTTCWWTLTIAYSRRVYLSCDWLRSPYYPKLCFCLPWSGQSWPGTGTHTLAQAPPGCWSHCSCSTLYTPTSCPISISHVSWVRSLLPVLRTGCLCGTNDPFMMRWMVGSLSLCFCCPISLLCRVGGISWMGCEVGCGVIFITWIISSWCWCWLSVAGLWLISSPIKTTGSPSSTLVWLPSTL